MVRIGIWAPRSAMKSNPPFSTRGSRLRAQNSRIFGSRSLMLRGVNTRESRRRWMWWAGGSSKMIDPGGSLDVALDELEDGSLAGDVGLPVHRAAIDVVETAHGEEVVALRCSTAAARRAAASRSDTGPSRSRSRTGRSRCLESIVVISVPIPGGCVSPGNTAWHRIKKAVLSCRGQGPAPAPGSRGRVARCASERSEPAATSVVQSGRPGRARWWGRMAKPQAMNGTLIST